MEERYNIERSLGAISFEDGAISFEDKKRFDKQPSSVLETIEFIENPKHNFRGLKDGLLDFLKETSLDIRKKIEGSKESIFIISTRKKDALCGIGIGEEQKYPGSREKILVMGINYPDFSIFGNRWRSLYGYIKKERGFKEYLQRIKK